ncbi:hypothetical protein [Luteimicrobium sp. DT211]|uniref:hypothetical protein n=1 Tax=Luteimicrobium sp. DT211 TaxID=3393412 RepID=UPI003CED4B08
MATDEMPTTADVGRRVVDLLRERLPETWKLRDTTAPDRNSPRFDLSIRLEGPDGRAVRLLADVKQVVERRDVAHLAGQLRSRAAGSEDTPVVAARYMSASVREALAQAGLSYVDATGNMRITVDSPALFISDRGQERDPWRKGRPRGTLSGEPAARVARALLDYDRRWSVRELTATSGASTGAAYRVLEYMQREALVVKGDRRYRVTDWEQLLRAWSRDASFQKTTRVTTYIEPRGLDAFLTKVAQGSPFPVAVTGSVAATEWATYAPAKAAYVYVSSIHEASERWGLRPNAAAPNVILLEPRTIGDVPFRNTTPAEGGYPVAAPAQVAADLLNGPGREPAEGQHLIDWMRANEERWRHA